MEDKPIIKRNRGRPRKVANQVPVVNVPVVAEQIPIVEPEPIVEPKPIVDVDIAIEPTKKERKSNPWVEHCSIVRARPENQGKSYRDILKIAKLDY
jgi:fused signal recognition particle receptor